MDCTRIVQEKPLSGRFNMAFDEAMLNMAVAELLCAVRVYQWKEPTVSLGHFQKIDEQLPEKSLSNLPRVRRLSGGGAILHDQEVTYSCVVPANHEFAADPSRLYDRVHSVISGIFRTLGASLVCRGVQQDEKEGAFLCFLRGDARDLLINQNPEIADAVCRASSGTNRDATSDKIVGSAQRRRKGAVLQHGSVLLRRSSVLADIPGIWDFFPDSETEDAAIANSIADGVAELLGHPVCSADTEKCLTLAARKDMEIKQPSPASAS